MKRFAIFISLIMLTLISFKPNPASCEPPEEVTADVAPPMTPEQIAAAVADARKEAANANDGSSPLKFAKNAEVARALIKEGVDVNAKDNGGFAPLHLAAQRGHVDVVKVLIEKGADIDAKTNQGATPLHIAAQLGHVDVVKVLIEKGADIDAKADGGVTPLYIAAKNGHAEVIKALIAAGVDINNSGLSGLLSTAVIEGHADVVKAFIDAKIVPWKDNRFQKNVFCRAVMKGHADVVKMLVNGYKSHKLEKFIDCSIFSHEGAPSAIAALIGDVELGRKSPARGYDLFIAASNGHVDFVKMLIDAGQDVNLKKNENGASPLSTAVQNGHANVVKVLIDAGADVNLKDKNGASPLSTAVQNGHADVVKILLGAGANVNQRGANGTSALLTAAQIGHADVVKVLIDAGANVHLRDTNGASPLCKAAQNGHANIVKALIAASADLNAKDNDGFAPLHLAAIQSHTDVVKVLIDAGVDVNAKDANGNLALYMAGSIDVVKTLLDAGADITDGADKLLCTAANNGNIEIVKMLTNKDIYDTYDKAKKIDIKKLVNSKCNSQPLLYQTLTDVQKEQQNKCEILKILITSGANVKEKLNDHTPMVVADYLKHHCAVEVLRAAGADETELKKLQKEAEQKQKEAAKRTAEYNRQVIYSLSPRGKCEAHCNGQYQKNTDSWKSCMNGCSDYRSDVIGNWP